MLLTLSFEQRAILAFSNVSCQFMAATRSGLLGLSVVSHVMEESKTVLVHAPNPNLQTEEKTAVYLDEMTSHAHVTHIGAQVMISTIWREIVIKHA